MSGPGLPERRGGREAESQEPDRDEPGLEAESQEPERGEPDLEAERREPDRGEPDRVVGTGLADVEVALLGLLSVRPMTGYEIRRYFDRALAPWWDTPRTQIYPKLRELEARRLIEHEYIVQESKPNKRVYSPTPAGRAQLQDWLRSAIAWPDLRHHMMMRLFLGYLLPASELGDLLAEYRDRTAEWAGQLREIDAKFSRSLSGPYHDAVFFELLSLRTLIDLADHEVAGADQALDVLAQAGERPPGDNGDRVGQLLDIIRDFPR